MAFSPYIIMLEMSSIDIILRFFHEKQLDAYAFDCWLLFRRFGVWWAEVYSYSVFFCRFEERVYIASYTREQLAS